MLSESISARREAEQALLASILVWPEIISEVKGKIVPEDFQDSKLPKNLHARIYRAMCQCDKPEQISVARKLNEKKQLESGDCTYLCNLVAGTFGHTTQTFYWDANDYQEYVKAIQVYSGKKINPIVRGGRIL